MKSWKKILAIVAGSVLALALAAGGLFWYWMEQPMYTPGMVRAGQNLRAPLAPAEPLPDGRFWKVEPDLQLYHFAVGNGRNVLIVHGGPGLPYTHAWPGLEPLAQSFRFHYYDQRGCGQSTRPFDRWTSTNYYENLTTLERTLGLGAQIADIERIRRTLGDEKVILIGHSWGGFLASLYAAEFPERVQALVLISPADMLVMPQPDGGLYEEVRRRLPTNLQSEYAAYLDAYFNFQNLFSKDETSLAESNARFGKYYAAVSQAAIPKLRRRRVDGSVQLPVSQGAAFVNDGGTVGETLADPFQHAAKVHKGYHADFFASPFNTGKTVFSIYKTGSSRADRKNCRHTRPVYRRHSRSARDIANRRLNAA